MSWAPPPPPGGGPADGPQMPMHGGMMQPGMMMPQAMQQQMMQQQMMQQQMMQQQMMQQGQPGLFPASGREPPPPPGPVSTEGRKKAAEYQRLMKKGDNEETCFVGGLRKTTDVDQITAHFAKFGQVENVDLKKQPDGTSRGFAFVRFKERGAVAKVIENRSKHMIDNKWIDVKQHSGVAACAGRAAALTKEEPKEEDDDPDPDDVEEKWTNNYLTMATQMQQGGDAEEEPEEPAPAPQQPILPAKSTARSKMQVAKEVAERSSEEAFQTWWRENRALRVTQSSSSVSGKDCPPSGQGLPRRPLSFPGYFMRVFGPSVTPHLHAAM